MENYNCILLIDDDSITNYINKTILSELNISEKIEIVNNGENAINFVTNHIEASDGYCPELILIDIKMPKVDEFGFLEMYHQLNFKNKDKVKLIILSSSDDVQDLRKSLNYSLSGYIVKPRLLKKDFLIDSKLRFRIKIVTFFQSLP